MHTPPLSYGVVCVVAVTLLRCKAFTAQSTITSRRDFAVPPGMTLTKSLGHTNHATKLWMAHNKNRSSSSGVVGRVLRRFSQSFLKGLALPFPILQNIAFSVRPNNQQERQPAFSINISVKEGLLALSLYLATGVVAYTKVLEKWSTIDALYFTSVCFSTVGYGDLCPTTPISRLFTCLFGMCGIAFLGAAVAAIGGKVVEAEVTAARAARQVSRNRIMSLFDAREGLAQVIQPFRKVQSKVLLEQAKKARKEFQDKIKEDRLLRVQHIETSLWLIFRRLATKTVSSLSIIFAGGLIMRHLNAQATSWSILESIYFSLVTASTIGFGDHAPQTKSARLFAVFFIPLAVAAAGELLSGVALALVRRRQQLFYERQLEKDLTIEHLNAMDRDSDGKITREEYVMFMLVEMGRLNSTELDELYSQFNRLDVSKSGYLDNEDLELMAKLRGANVLTNDSS